MYAYQSAGYNATQHFCKFNKFISKIYRFWGLEQVDNDALGHELVLFSRFFTLYETVNSFFVCNLYLLREFEEKNKKCVYAF